MIRVLVVDDHARMRKSIRMLLERSGEVTVVGEAEDGKQALSQIRRLKPDLVILDISMPVMNGLEVLDALAARDESPQIIVLSMNDSDDLIQRALRDGAFDFVAKRDASSHLLSAVRRAADDGTVDNAPFGGANRPLPS
jgi:DNA-binding NarL/FixJ family response regulator